MIAALLFASALQVPQPADSPPEDKAAGLASVTFMWACFLPISAFDTSSEYAAQAAHIGADQLYSSPGFAGVRVDGANGRGCRVRYVGARASAVWDADAKFLRTTARPAGTVGDGCVLSENAADRVAALCTQTSDGQNARPIITRRADVLLERSGSDASGSVTASVLNPRP